MKKTTARLFAAGLALAASLALTACPEKEEGPAEKAGKKVDETAEKLKDTVNPKGPAEKLGEKVDKATGN